MVAWIVVVAYWFALDLSNRSGMGKCNVNKIKEKKLVRKDTNSALTFNTFWLE